MVLVITDSNFDTLSSISSSSEAFFKVLLSSILVSESVCFKAVMSSRLWDLVSRFVATSKAFEVSSGFLMGNVFGWFRYITAPCTAQLQDRLHSYKYNIVQDYKVCLIGDGGGVVCCCWWWW